MQWPKKIVVWPDGSLSPFDDSLGMGTIESTINDALANLLRRTRHAWGSPGVVQSENTGKLKGNERPDILVMEPNVPPLAIETEVLPAVTVEKEARSRLGHRLRKNDQPIFSSIAVRMPTRLRDVDGDDLVAALRAADDFEFALFQGEDEATVQRWPSSGWLTGGVVEISVIAQHAAVPPKVIEQATECFIDGIRAAAGRLGELATKFRGAMKHICEILHQGDSEQTRRMAMTIVADAFIFHESLAGGSGALGDIRTVDEIRNGSGRIAKEKILIEWQRILQINYWPIFDVARRIVEQIPVEGASEILDRLAKTAAILLSNRAARSHDLTGAVFQKLIADRKFLAAFYTMPPSATLLANLALAADKTPQGGSWADASAIEALRVADFACGTGTLLSAAYQRIGQLHELGGGDSECLHPTMMADVLVGCDVMPAAAYLTASMLSALHPSVSYTRSKIMSVPYGLQDDGQIALGSLDLLKAQATFSIMSTFAKGAGSKGEYAANTWAELPHLAFDLVLMNPPFTRATGEHEAEHVAPAAIPMFAAFGADDKLQHRMSTALKSLTHGTTAHGNAGEASIFLVLADKKLKARGRLGLVMPLSILAGDAWEKSRKLLRESYSDLVIVTIAGARGDESSFSADTGMAEALIIATKGARSKTVPRATVTVLRKRPTHQLQAFEIARAICAAASSGAINRLEDGPIGGTPLSIGKDVVGSVMDAPLPSSGIWPIARIADLSLAQTANELTVNSRLWLPGVAESGAEAIPISRLGDSAGVGPLHRDINGKGDSGGAIRGPFDVTPLAGGGTTYPMLWAHDAKRERTLVLSPDSEGTIRKGKTAAQNALIRQRAANIWATASRAHASLDFRYNSQALGVALTDDPCVGGRAWPSVIFTDPDHERAFAVFGNCTIGLLLFWWAANKTQDGRGSLTLSTLPELPTLRFAALGKWQLSAAVTIFEEMKDQALRPFNEIEHDPVRRELDRRVLGEVLGLRCATDPALHLLRRKLSQEPTIVGHKRRAKPGIVKATPGTEVPAHTGKAKPMRKAKPYAVSEPDLQKVAESVRPPKK